MAKTKTAKNKIQKTNAKAAKTPKVTNAKGKAKTATKTATTKKKVVKKPVAKTKKAK
ncbi:hypothetical protein [Lactococcus hircilactis]|uniref:hypothetical protein n=1 Tax=Lactococcus hircilactis TaxID=1494462 RepID=UPI003FA1FD68